MRKLVVVLVIAATCGAALGAGVALATTQTYAGPKTWLPGYDAAGSYSTNWYANTMADKSKWQPARVAFIDGAGSWHDSYTDSLPNTTTFDYSGLSVRPYCKNNSSATYTAKCFAITN